MPRKDVQTMRLYHLIALITLLLTPAASLAQPAVVPKTNPMKVYAHYMPWFQSPTTLGAGKWGYHWRMNTRDPNIIDANGQREIASHNYPLIGPYDSSDPNVIEYHLLLMKASGIDGVIIDWYGKKGTNGDIAPLLRASDAMASSVGNYGLKVGVCLEDRYAASTADVTANIDYLRQNYFNKSSYIRQADNKPLMMVFGPTQFQKPNDWATIMAGAGEKPALLTLQNQSQEAGAAASGEFGWIYQNQAMQDHLARQKAFLTQQAPKLNTVAGVAYPGFNDYYAEGGAGDNIGFDIPANNGQTLAQVLAQDAQYSANMNMLQLGTWNDYGEGTMFEPTVETGFTYLEQIQKFTGVPYGRSELELISQLYFARVALAGKPEAKPFLDTAAAQMNSLDFVSARSSLAQAQRFIPEPAALSALAAACLLLRRHRGR